MLSVNPKLDAMCEMLKTIHDLQERNKMLEAQIEKMKCCGNCRYFDRDEPKYCDKGVFNAYICDKWRFAND